MKGLWGGLSYGAKASEIDREYQEGLEVKSDPNVVCFANATPARAHFRKRPTWTWRVDYRRNELKERPWEGAMATDGQIDERDAT